MELRICWCLVRHVYLKSWRQGPVFVLLVSSFHFSFLWGTSYSSCNKAWENISLSFFLTQWSFLRHFLYKSWPLSREIDLYWNGLMWFRILNTIKLLTMNWHADKYFNEVSCQHISQVICQENDTFSRCPYEIRQSTLVFAN